MTDIADVLRADHREILALVAAWAADPRGTGASGRFIAIIDSLTVHARFVDVVIAPFIPPSAGADTAVARQIFRAHHSVMSLLDGLRQAVDHGLFWAMHLGILTEVVCPHLILHDHLLLTALRPTIPAIQFDDLGHVFLSVKDEVVLAALTTRAREPLAARMLDLSPGLRDRQHGHYPAHHPAPAIPWRPLPFHDRSGLRPGADPARLNPRSRRCIA